MTRWFRFYDETLNDPKILKLSDNLHRIWVGVLCAASKNDGHLPPLNDLALMIRIKPAKMAAALESLIKSGLVDTDGAILSPHNWNKRQYKSDVSTERVKRFRNASKTVSVTPPETETETEKKEEAAEAAPPKIYAFESGVIKLNQKHFDQWKQSFVHINLPAKLLALTDWAGQQRNWFNAVRSALAKADALALADLQREKPAPFKWNGIEGVI